MRKIELLKEQEAFLTSHLDLAEKEYAEFEAASQRGRQFPNIHLKVNLILRKVEIFMHRDTVRRLIDACGRIEELERENSRLRSLLEMKNPEPDKA